MSRLQLKWVSLAQRCKISQSLLCFVKQYMESMNSSRICCVKLRRNKGQRNSHCLFDIFFVLFLHLYSYVITGVQESLQIKEQFTNQVCGQDEEGGGQKMSVFVHAQDINCPRSGVAGWRSKNGKILSIYQLNDPYQ